MKRRTVLRTTGALVAGATGGCLGVLGDDTVPADEIEVEWERCEYAPSLTFVEEHHEEPRAVHVTTRSDAESAFTPGSLTDEAAAGVEAFVDATDFEEALLLLVRALVPDGCHYLEVESLDMTTASVLTGSAAVVDDTEDRGGCTQAMRDSRELVRVRTEPKLPTHAELEVELRRDDVREVRSEPPP